MALIVSAPWVEQYYTNGLKSLRLYARAWKISDDPTKDGLWKACLQPIVNGVVMAEQVTEYTWVPKDEVFQWGTDQLPEGFRACTKQVASLGRRGKNQFGDSFRGNKSHVGSGLISTDLTVSSYDFDAEEF